MAFQHVLCKVDIPSLATSHGQYHLSAAFEKKIAKDWKIITIVNELYLLLSLLCWFLTLYFVILLTVFFIGGCLVVFAVLLIVCDYC